ncbi:MAG TPA: hypothetical protein VFB20_04475 [Burkholderiales bacterium]|nr:hypothetical protein [Burkholderiales bacterium]
MKQHELHRVVRAFLSAPLFAASLVHGPAHAAADSPESAPAADDGYFANWFERVDRAQESQPHWITPLATVTPRLEQEFRYDQIYQDRPKGANFTSYGGGKGLELIPTERTELIINVPAYQTLDRPDKPAERGWADESLLLKYRMLSANEENGNYIVTGFLGLSVPTGDEAFTTHHTIVTPTLAAGKGWGSRDEGFDIQSTLGISFPDGDQGKVGVPTVWNTTLQAHIFQRFWPEIEFSYTHWKDGPNDGKNQLIVTYGLVYGRIPLGGRSKLILGLGYQTSQATAFTTYDRAWLGTARVTF